MTTETRVSEKTAAYGYCPKCGAPGLLRERRPNGNDQCRDGHTYPSATSVKLPLLEGGKGEARLWLVTYNKPDWSSTGVAYDAESAEAERKAGAEVTPLYTAPQPAAQQPAGDGGGDALPQKLVPQRIICPLVEAARCLGVAQAKGDKPAIAHWDAETMRQQGAAIAALRANAGGKA